MSKIRIISGWSAQGGSTVAFINLCNLFNENGIDCTFYGPHTWHLDKCQSGGFKDNPLSKPDTDVFILHFINPDIIPDNLGKCILSIHETNLYPLSQLDYKKFDLIHYVSNNQRAWHAVNHPYKIIPNVLDKLKGEPKGEKRIAAVIGSIDRHKQTHLSLQRALQEDFDEIHLYGLVTDAVYAETTIQPLLEDNPKIIHKGHEDDKQKMYNTVHKVFHSSARETFNYIKAECELTNTEYDGLETAETDAQIWTNDQILEAWEKIL